MYFEYMRERRPEIKIKQTELGFATYKYMNVGKDLAVYIEDIWITPEYRKTKAASQLSESITAEAKLEGATTLLGTVCPSANNSTDSIKVLLAHGMRLLKAEDDLIWFYKEI